MRTQYFSYNLICFLYRMTSERVYFFLSQCFVFAILSTKREKNKVCLRFETVKRAINCLSQYGKKDDKTQGAPNRKI